MIALTVPELEGAVVACAEAGISGYVTREGSLDNLVTVVDCAVRGETVMSPKMISSLLRRVSILAADHASETARPELTRRERQIWTWSPKAARTSRSPGTGIELRHGEEPRAQHPREAGRASAVPEAARHLRRFAQVSRYTFGPGMVDNRES